MKTKPMIVCAMVACLSVVSVTSVIAEPQTKATDAPKEAPVLPPFLNEMSKELGLTDKQMAKFAEIKKKREALQQEFWNVFTDEQKNKLLQDKFRRGHGQLMRHDRDGKRDGDRDGKGREGKFRRDE